MKKKSHKRMMGGGMAAMGATSPGTRVARPLPVGATKQPPRKIVAPPRPPRGGAPVGSGYKPGPISAKPAPTPAAPVASAPTPAPATPAYPVASAPTVTAPAASPVVAPATDSTAIGSTFLPSDASGMKPFPTLDPRNVKPALLGGEGLSTYSAPEGMGKDLQGNVYTPPEATMKKGGAVKGKKMRGGGLARKGVGMALRGGGLARKGVGMALAKGGLAKRAGGCATRGYGRGKMV